ncbi:ATP11 protein-domain-containing protein [Melampsora americana]|nr:ATP11 protein-domain-containing protein [Melampsora americana]
MLNRLITSSRTSHHHQLKSTSINSSRTFLNLHHQTLNSSNSTQSIKPNQNSFEAKYQSKLKEKLKQTGLKDLNELKRLSNERIKLQNESQRKLDQELLKKFQKSNLLNRSQSQPEKKLEIKEKKYKSPIKPLNSIINLSKLIHQSSDSIKQLWIAYHLKPSSPPRLGAVIPLETYQNILKVAKRYPSFVLPIPSESTQTTTHQTPLQNHFLQWSFLPPEEPLSDLYQAFQPIQSPTPQISPTTVLFTPLAEFQLKQEFAQPALILTHYTELAQSHGIILMRADLTPSLDDPTRSGRISTTEAQLLILRLQQFYHWSNLDSLSNDSKKLKLQNDRQDLLKKFHERPHEFKIEELIESIQDL